MFCASTNQTIRSTADVDPGEGMKNPENIQKPQDHGDYHHNIQDALNRSLHGDETIHQPQQKSNHNQDHHDLK